ncbi:TRAP-type C4-dicarboxylate transport system, substrate-binding protein [Tistlia consotensis]|uniref:TRAP-type C4-dicarboxylate transport system, substrate-binding protein n=1 Tax=Tistlia consotensis USBA 355 TaxID=560819 RepID=A0A1Y6CD47_9PROT|nr:TRAP transporter substrate-binding protein DctP [Tistlia consotensis]SMF55464.1 TRAP-type C4-dicarboxylate transport system, substrate-binding protein [Tistlia consotensis USBA 355]SNR88487.1 TRAP-type C4-dicarboxylate transport system, substrate-binding protein [Tistlia consotensis]
MKKVDRRKVLAGMSAGALALGLGARPLRAAKIEVTVAHGSPLKHVIAAQGVQPWMDRVTELTGGAVKFNYYPAGQIAKLKELLSALQSGVADFVPVPVGYVSDKLPLNGVSMLPGLGGSSQAIVTAHSDQLADGGALAKEFASQDCDPLWVMAFPPYQIVSTGDPIKTVDDFKGKVIRSAGGSMNLVINALGASPAEIPVSDMYVALERGTVGATISALSSLKPYKVDEIMKAASTNGSFGTFVNIFCGNAKKMASLPKEIRDAMVQAGKDTQTSASTFMDNEVGGLIKEFEGAGKTMYAFAPDQLKAINAELAKVQDEWVKRLADRGLPADKVLAKFRELTAS